MTPYYSKDGITIYHGRAEEIVTLLPADHFGTLVLDAPFTFHAKDMDGVLRPFSRSLKDDCTILALSLTETVEKSPRFGHPNVRSLDQMRETLKWTEGAILDPYMGVGSSLVAARQLGREAVGIEIEEKWCALSVIRLENKLGVKTAHA